MKSHHISILALGLFISSACAQDKPDLTSPRQKTSYALGMDIVSTLQREEVDVDVKALSAGIADTLAGKPELTSNEVKTVMADLSKTMTAKEEAERKLAAEKNLRDGEAYLAANADKDGVKVVEVTAPDGSKAGLQYLVLKSGSGPSPGKQDVVEVHYEGFLTDGTMFDSSIKRGTSITFGMDQIIPGWAAALQRMKVGDKWRLFIPAKLGYGAYGPPQIPPNSALIFNVELLSFYTPKPHSATNAPAGEAEH